MKIVFPGGSRVDAKYKGFVIKTDQPVHGGGENSAPAPFDYFLSSVGTCAGIYVLGFLQQRKLSTENVKLILSTVKDRERRMLSKITIKVVLPDSFPMKYKNAIVSSVNLCSVKKHMHEPPQFETIVTIGDEEVAVSIT